LCGITVTLRFCVVDIITSRAASGNMGNMELAFIICSMVLLLSSVDARGAGRAFPIESENYAIDRFTSVNPQLEWDPTNFLIDLAGNYANCDSAGTRAREISVNKLTPDGKSISGVVDSLDGSRADVDAVNGYIRTIIDDWVNRRTYNNLIRGASRFGCSVRPGCRGSVVVSCLFSPAGSTGDEQGNQPSNIVQVQAQAFTPQQYAIAEVYTGNKWDQSHFLENLSGIETKCAMIDDEDWPFTDLRKVEDLYGVRINPVYGSTTNDGSTPAALDRILPGFKQIRNAKEIGCSLIPDCVRGSQMFVVVTCLYMTE